MWEIWNPNWICKIKKEGKIMAEGRIRETLISFESGHYKKITGRWRGDSIWTHFEKDSGGEVHINKDKVEYMETFAPEQNKGTSEERPEPTTGRRA